jgi:hypothetical protein
MYSFSLNERNPTTLGIRWWFTNTVVKEIYVVTEIEFGSVIWKLWDDWITTNWVIVSVSTNNQEWNVMDVKEGVPDEDHL